MGTSVDKRLAKRQKRKVARAKERVRISEPDVRTPDEIKAAREASRVAADAQRHIFELAWSQYQARRTSLSPAADPPGWRRRSRVAREGFASWLRTCAAHRLKSLAVKA